MNSLKPPSPYWHSLLATELSKCGIRLSAGRTATDGRQLAVSCDVWPVLVVFTGACGWSGFVDRAFGRGEGVDTVTLLQLPSGGRKEDTR